jgi:carnosine N-methyltransferase
MSKEKEHWNTIRRAMLLYDEYIEAQLKYHPMNRMGGQYGPDVSDRGKESYKSVKKALQSNVNFLHNLVRETNPGVPALDPHEGEPVPLRYMDKVDAVLHSIYREWSLEGAGDRAHFDLLVKTLREVVPVDGKFFRKNVLVPGCGLGRLAVEICRYGYNVQMNEYSVFMLLANSFIVNGSFSSFQSDRPTIYPWLTSSSNVISYDDIEKGIIIPDVTCNDLLCDSPCHEHYIEPDEHEIPSNGIPDLGYRLPRLSMKAGDFVTVYGASDNHQKWDAIVTCFFIDTAPNILTYIRVIKDLLIPGGTWINFGPLLYHWEVDSDETGDDRYNHNVSLPWEEIEYQLKHNGFILGKNEWHDAEYAQRPNSMLKTTYRCKFFTAQTLTQSNVEDSGDKDDIDKKSCDLEVKMKHNFDSINNETEQSSSMKRVKR